MKINLHNQYDTKNYLEPISKIVTITSNLFSLQKQTVNIILVTNKTIQELNHQFRKKDYPTDVLTFPDGELGNQGDIFISIDKCKEQAVELGHSFERELGFLTVHGLLHTLGYDHQTEEQEQAMIERQNQILHKAKLYR